MKKFLALFAVVLMLASLTPDADAAMRFGGGRSFGRSTSSLFQKATPAKPAMAGKTAPGASQATPNAARPGAAQQTAKTGTAAAAATARPMGGMFMGIAAALGLTALMSALGLSAEFAQILVAILLAIVAFYAIRFIAGLFLLKRVRQTTQSAYTQTQAQTQTAQSYSAGESAVYEQGQARPGSVMDSFSTEAGLESLTVPAGFDAKGFEAVARDNFIRLQKAWDKGDVVPVADFMTDDFFIALTHQLRDHGYAEQKSEVVDLTTKLLGITQEGNEYVAVVAFEGAMKINGEFEEVHERWLLIQAADGSTGWLLAGLEQM